MNTYKTIENLNANGYKNFTKQYDKLTGGDTSEILEFHERVDIRRALIESIDSDVRHAVDNQFDFDHPEHDIHVEIIPNRTLSKLPEQIRLESKDFDWVTYCSECDNVVTRDCGDYNCDKCDCA